ncbi:MAG: hypothetical protein AB4058_15400 [Microcystaceae cyanobacterium]
MTQKLTTLMLVLLLSLFAASCNRGEEVSDEENAGNSPPPPAQPQTNNQDTPPAQVFETTSPPPVATLIAPTTANQRREDIATGRTDPYAPFPSKVEVERPEPEIQEDNDISQEQGDTPNGSSDDILIDEPLPLPVPEEAEAVIVSGVIQLGGSPVAILTSPGEPGTRHVRPGTMIASGQVLVKSINVSNRDGFVVLEQYGQEVTKMVGEAAQAAETSES